MRPVLLLLSLGLVSWGLSPSLHAEDQASKDEPKDPKVLSVDDYGSWKRIVSVRLSPDGKWMAYGYRPNEGEETLFIKELDGETLHEIPRGRSPGFTEDSRYAFFNVAAPKKGKGKAELVLLNLEEGTREGFEGAQSARSNETSSHLLIRMGGGGTRGADLLVRALGQEETRHLGSVGQYSLNEEGTHLAYTVQAEKRLGNGVYLLTLDSGVLAPLDTGRFDYSQLTWNESGTSLAFLRGRDVEGCEHRDNDLVVIEDVVGSDATMVDYVPTKHRSFPDGFVISEFASLIWSEDDSRVFCGLKRQQDEIAKSKEERPNVDVWHWNDDRVQSVQQRRSRFMTRATFRSVFHVESERFLVLADEALPRVDVVGKGRWGLGRADEKYRREVTWGGARADYYRVDPRDGSRKLITASLGRPMGTSPSGSHFLFLKGGQVWCQDLSKLKTLNLTKKIGIDFVNHADDHPYEKPTFGVAGWSADGNSVILNHQFDLYAVKLDGSEAINLTGGLGEKEQIRFRYLRLDPEEETIDLEKPLLLSATGEWTKKSGFYRLEPKEELGGEPEVLTFEDRRYGRPIKASDADRVVITRETFVDFPDYWATDTNFGKFARVTEANPQQKEFAWGERKLIDYENRHGQRLQATVTFPAGYEEGKRYPALVYFYEKMSSRHHSYSFPRYDDRPHMSTYASDGYVVIMPDVVYEIGRPGDSAVDCVTSAVRKALEMGFVDPDRIALQGHSWGGYQSSFILTQTDLFCAVVTGAPVTNLVSFHGELYKSSGSVQQGITEKGQVRMGTTPWENMELYHSQSPVHNVREIQTPFIILHGTDDGAVDWHQGLEFYNAARRHDKWCILLSYPGEGHHLQKRANQIDFQIRMKQFFDHHCKGTEAPEWMTEGVPFLQKDRASPRPPKESAEPEEKEKAPPKTKDAEDT